MMKFVSRICCLGIIGCLLLGTGAGFSRYCRTAAQYSCASAEGQIYQSLDDTLKLLETLSMDPWMTSEDISDQQRAVRLNEYNEIWDYMMIRFIDNSGNLYRADHQEAIANMNSREYIQALWMTNQPQVTDVFLAGTDGKTLNFTIAAAIADDAGANGAVFAAIEESQINAILTEQPLDTALLGKKQQYMSGSDASLLGVTLETRLSGSRLLGGSLEDALLRVKNEESGTFWCLDGWLPTCFAFRNVGLDSGWTVLASSSFADAIADMMPVVIFIAIIVFLSLIVFILSGKKEDHRTT